MALAIVTFQPRTGRLLLAVREGPLEAAAATVDGASLVGRHEGFAVFALAPTPRGWGQIRDAFEPNVGPGAQAIVQRLEREADAIEAAATARIDDSPLDFDCALRTDPMAHQRAALRFARSLIDAQQPGAGLFMEQGTGKSLVAIGVAGLLHLTQRYRFALVVGPNSLKGTWGDPDPQFGEVAKHCAIDADLTVLRESRAKRHAVVEKALQRERFQWIVTNYEHFAVPTTGRNADPLVTNFTALCREAGPGLLVLDECSMIKNHRSHRSKALHQLSSVFPFTVLLTGTPVTRSPLDVWSQFQCLRPGILGYATFLAFERAYAIRQHNGCGWQVVGFKPGALDELERRVGQYAFRARAADCLDLPPVTTQTVRVETSAQQDRLLRELRDDMMAEMGEGLVDGRNVLTRYLRMQQILGGFVGLVDEDGEALGRAEPLKSNPKLDAFTEYMKLTLDDPDAKVVAFFRFKAEIAAVAELCRREGWGTVEFHGDVPGDERDEGRKRFQRDADCRVLLAQYQAGARGLNLTAGNHIAFYSLTFDLEDYLQALKRVDRIGQDRPVTVTHFVAERPKRGRARGGATLDHVLLDALRRKKGWADVVTGDARAEQARLAEVA